MDAAASMKTDASHLAAEDFKKQYPLLFITEVELRRLSLKDLYRLDLNIPEEEEIGKSDKKIYRHFSLKYHPDKIGNNIGVSVTTQPGTVFGIIVDANLAANRHDDTAKADLKLGKVKKPQSDAKLPKTYYGQHKPNHDYPIPGDYSGTRSNIPDERVRDAIAKIIEIIESEELDGFDWYIEEIGKESDSFLSQLFAENAIAVVESDHFGDHVRKTKSVILFAQERLVDIAFKKNLNQFEIFRKLAIFAAKKGIKITTEGFNSYAKDYINILTSSLTADQIFGVAKDIILQMNKIKEIDGSPILVLKPEECLFKIAAIVDFFRARGLDPRDILQRGEENLIDMLRKVDFQMRDPKFDDRGNFKYYNSKIRLEKHIRTGIDYVYDQLGWPGIGLQGSEIDAFQTFRFMIGVIIGAEEPRAIQGAQQATEGSSYDDDIQSLFANIRLILKKSSPEDLEKILLAQTAIRYEASSDDGTKNAQYTKPHFLYSHIFEMCWGKFNELEQKEDKTIFSLRREVQSALIGLLNLPDNNGLHNRVFETIVRNEALLTSIMTVAAHKQGEINVGALTSFYNELGDKKKAQAVENFRFNQFVAGNGDHLDFYRDYKGRSLRATEGVQKDFIKAIGLQPSSSVSKATAKASTLVNAETSSCEIM